MNKKSMFDGNQKIPREIKNEDGMRIESRRNDNGTEFRFDDKVLDVLDVAIDMRNAASSYEKFSPDWWVCELHDSFPFSFHFSDDKEDRRQQYADYGFPIVVQEAIEASIEKAKELKEN